MTAELAALADWIQDQLADELASRQAIAEHALAEVRAIDARASARSTAGDQRVISAREYLDAVRPRKVNSRGRDVLVREAAELRKLLGQVLDYVAETRLSRGLAAAVETVPVTGVLPDESPTLSPADLIKTLDALELAERAMRERAAVWCLDCEASPAGACDTCLDALDQADAYKALAARLGGDDE